MADLGSLVVSVSANVARFESALTKAEQTAKKRTNAINRSLRSVSKVAKGLGAGLLAGLGLRGFVQGIQQAAQAVDDLNNEAIKLGLTTDQLQELRFAAAAVGVDFKQLGIGFQRFERRMADAFAGNSGLQKSFDQIGVKITDTNGKLRDAMSVFLDYGEAVSRLGSSNEQILATFRVLDTEGVNVVRLFKKGADGMKSLMQQAVEMGAVLDSKTVKTLADVNTQMTLINRVMNVQAQTGFGAFADSLREVKESFAQVSKQMARFATEASPAVAAAVNGLSLVFRTFVLGIITLKNAWDATVTAFISGAMALGQALQGDFKLAFQTLTDGGTDMIAQLDDLVTAYNDLFTDIKIDIQDADTAGSSFNNTLKDMGGAAAKTAQDFSVMGQALDQISAQMDKLESSDVDLLTGANDPRFEAKMKVRAIADQEDPTRELQRQIDDLTSLSESEFMSEQDIDVINGRILTLQGNIDDAMNGIADTSKMTSDKTSEFWLEAARRMENAMSDQFFNIMQGNFENMGQQFKTTIDRMVADLLAAQFFDLVKTSFGAGGGLASFAGLFGRAGGGPVAANQPYVVGEQGPELFVPKSSGSIVPNHRMGAGAVTVVQNVMTPDVNSFRHSGRQLAQDQARLLGQARAMS